MKNIIISDPSLRDGNHAVRHKISIESIERYCKFADDAGVPIIEVGHGNGQGASSILIGQASVSDRDMLKAARKSIKKAKLGIHLIPGMGTVKKDVIPAIEEGVDVFRIACHATEATITKSHIEYLRSKDKTVYGVLMMSPLATTAELVENAKHMEEYGAELVLIMDSTGTYMPDDVKERITALMNGLSIGVGFHAHNNLGCAVANTLVAAKLGAKVVDGCIRGFGAGAGNAPLEIIVPVLEKNGFNTGIDVAKIIKGADEVGEYLVKTSPTIAPINILTGLNRIFSGFEKPIIKASKLYGVEYSSIIFELGNRKLVAGQEDLIMEVAQKIKKEKESHLANENGGSYL